MIQVSEVIRRSDQGVTRPFICRDEEGRQLWVKGAAWSKSELVAEWICAQLALQWGLPLAEFDLAFVEPDIVAFSVVPEIASLGVGCGFGSIHAHGAAELNFSDISKIDIELRADLLLFDYWVQNEDRILGEGGGNPNLLLKVESFDLVVIDHNSAFDIEFNRNNFFENHVFSQSIEAWDEEFKKSRHEKILALLQTLPDTIRSIPEEWFEGDDELGHALIAEVDRVGKTLSRVSKDPQVFWEVV